MSHDDLSRIDKTSVSISLDPIMTIAEAERFDGRGSTQSGICGDDLSRLVEDKVLWLHSFSSQTLILIFIFIINSSESKNVFAKCKFACLGSIQGSRCPGTSRYVNCRSPG